MMATTCRAEGMAAFSCNSGLKAVWHRRVGGARLADRSDQVTREGGSQTAPAQRRRWPPPTEFWRKPQAHRRKWPGLRSVVEVFTIFSIIVTLAVSTTTLKTTIDQNRRQNELTSQGQVADRFAKAVDQLNSPELGARLGGIYSLQTIALDSKDIGYDRSAGSVLYAFVDQNSKNAPLCPTDLEVSKHNSTNPDGWGYGLRTTSPDVELAVQVLASIPYRSSPEINEPGHTGIFTDEQYASLTQVSKDEADRDTSTLVRWKPSKCWRDIELRHLDLHNWNLYGFDVSDAVFDGSTLNGAILDRTRLHGTKFRGSALDGAWLILV